MLNSGPEALLSTDEMAEADRLTIAGGTAGALLMEQAGAAVAREAARQLGRSGRAAVLC
ncbi:MAG TPA: bifunctional ADP-dependent NAD(P)H-hydrate dehydratase/NAD(P)H-hydrate epimerase, partial [Methylocella sp.]|nr:bifunctional ADP-dependent NAD(P)H-hydrate dehydratase/NAD(P)H-hydrate epimerase [Methylocella sp.]